MSDSAEVGILVSIFFFATITGMAFQGIVCFFLIKPLKKIPERHQLISPVMVWLLIIPIFNLVWNLFVVPQIAASLKKFADAQGNCVVGDCAETLGWTYCIIRIIAFVCFLPFFFLCVGVLLEITAIVLLVLFLVKTNSIARQLEE